MKNFRRDIKGVIFDVDGVLLDSMGIWTDLGARYLVSIGKTPEEGLAEILFSMSMEQGAEYLKGLFSAARDIMFGENDFLRMTDELITGMDSDDFIEVLPQLRLAFGYFTPQETAETAKAAAALHSGKQAEIRFGKVIDEKLYKFGAKLDKEIMEIIEK